VTEAAQPIVLDRPVPARGLASAVMLRLIVPIATMLTIGAVALLMLLTPFYLHPALDAAASPAWLGMSAQQAHDYSDETVSDLVLGPGTFELTAPNGTPFYDADERGHMRDVRVVLYGFLALAAVSAVVFAYAVARSRTDRLFARAISSGGLSLVVGTIVLGVFAAVAFDTAFELFHELLFPGGNFTFDPTKQRLVQLYPIAFWQLTSAALGVLLIAGGALAWFVGRRRAAGAAR
jgi:integral membrane protein (TIGR01906 family)